MSKLQYSTRLTLLLILIFSLLGMPLTTWAAAKPDTPIAGTSTVYVVQPGDSLAAIARAMYGDEGLWQTLYAVNAEVIGPNPRLIHPGQQLHLLDLGGSEAPLGSGEVENVAKLEEKTDHPDEAAAFWWLVHQDENGYVPPDGYLKAARHIEMMRNTPPPAAGLNATTSWEWLGPGNIGGRIRSILINPDNPDEMWLGSVGGGIWKTVNGGASWEPVDDFMANLAVSCMAMHPITPTIMFAGTGEGFYNVDALRGAGIFKSVDGGETWSQIPSTATSDWYFVNRIAISPDGSTMLAATNTGIFRSTDEGNTWTQVLWGHIDDVDFDPTDSSKAVAGVHSGGVAFYSTDGGATWNLASFASSTDGRIEIAYAPSDPSIVYVSMDHNNGEIWKSTDGGQNYSLVNTGNEYLSTQGWYGNIIWVNPYDPDFIVVGGIDLWRSTDGGVHLEKISQWYKADSIHADHHAIVESPLFDNTTNRTVFFGNDGGIYKTDDIATVTYTVGWQELNNNLGITQFYGGAGNTISGKIVGGAQDNGTLVYNGNTEGWHAMFGGDGGYCAADPEDVDYLYGEYTDLRIHRSTDGGISSSYIYNGISDAGNAANFIAPFILDPNNPNTMLAGGAHLWRSTNIKDDTPDWSSIKDSTGVYISAIAIAPGDSDLVWVGHNNGDVFFTTNGTAITPTWTRVDTATPALPNRYVSRITIDPEDHDKVYVSFGGFSADNIYRTTDGGQTWTDITGDSASPTGLPEVPVHDLEINPYNSSWLYAATDVGVFTSEDGGENWYLPQDGPANVSVYELFWMDDNLIAVTHGRGMFQASPGDGSGTITIAKEAQSDIAWVGEVITYAIIVNNPNPTQTLTLDLTDTLPAGVSFVSATNGGSLAGDQVIWNDLSVPSYTKQTVAEVSFLVESGPFTQVVNVAEASSDEFPLAVSEPITVPRCAALFKDDQESSPNLWTESYDTSAEERHWELKDDGHGYKDSTHYWYVAEADGWAFEQSTSYLTSPPITVTAMGASHLLLHFWHQYDLFTYNGSGFNSGLLEIKVNDGNWTYVDNSHFVQNGYNYPIYNDSKEGFSGNSEGYIESIADISDFVEAGDTLQVRFTYLNQFADSRDGWYVDDVYLCQKPTDYFTITKQAPATAIAGTPITFTIVVSNVSPVTITDFVITDVVPSGAHYVSGGVLNGNVVSWTVPIIGPISAVTKTFVVTAMVDITNSDYSVLHPASGVGANGAVPVVVHVENVPDVTIAKAVEPTTPAPGEAVTFTLTFSNLGAQTATGIVITDVMPTLITDLHVITSGAIITPQGGTPYAWKVADLAHDEGGIITITGVLSESVAEGTLITNTAIITAAADGNPSNNSASVVMQVANLPPIAEAGAEQWVKAGEMVTLDGSASYDPNGGPLIYHWTQIGGPVTVTLSDASIVSPTFTVTETGIFTFTLTVTDTGGLSASDTTDVVVAHQVYLPLVLKNH